MLWGRVCYIIIYAKLLKKGCNWSFMATHSHISYGNDASLRHFDGIFSDKSCPVCLNEGFEEKQQLKTSYLTISKFSCVGAFFSLYKANIFLFSPTCLMSTTCLKLTFVVFLPSCLAFPLIWNNEIRSFNSHGNWCSMSQILNFFYRSTYLYQLF